MSFSDGFLPGVLLGVVAGATATILFQPAPVQQDLRISCYLGDAEPVVLHGPAFSVISFKGEGASFAVQGHPVLDLDTGVMCAGSAEPPEKN